ncbi:hypothetical protein Ancab_012747 [Ancistrocladus abbreviatus]
MATLSHNNDNQTGPKKTENWFLGCFGLSGEKKEAKTACGLARRKNYFRLNWLKFGNLKKSAENAVVLGKSSSNKVKTQRCNKYGGVIVEADQTLPITEVARAVQLWSKEVSSMGLQSRPHQCESVHKHLKQLVNRKGNEKDKQADSVGSNKPAAGLVKKSRAEVKKRLTDGGDTMIGLSIFVAWLIITLTWGRLCAILCTTAGFYLMPCLRKKASQNDTNEDLTIKLRSLIFILDLYKRSVILKGFFQQVYRILIVVSSYTFKFKILYN